MRGGGKALLQLSEGVDSKCFFLWVRDKEDPKSDMVLSRKSHLRPGPWLKQTHYHLGSVFVCRVVLILEREP